MKRSALKTKAKAALKGYWVMGMIPVVGTVINILFLTPYVTATRAQFYEELKAIKG